MSFEVLKQQVSGKVILPADTGYDEARTVYNAMIDKKPAAILKCESEQDVVTGIRFAKERDMEVAIRGGGHSGPGFGLVDNGLVLELSGLKDVQVDKWKKTVVVGGGCTLGDIDQVLTPLGLMVPFGVASTTGIGGLALGGGLGYFTRMGGLSIDNLLEARVILASGEIVTANADSHPDLFWALRGGGGNFGVVVSFTFKTHEVRKIYAGPIMWPIENAREVLQFYDEFTKDLTNDLNGVFVFMRVPQAEVFPEELHDKHVCAIVWCYTGPFEQAEEVFKPIREFRKPVIDWAGEFTVQALNSLFDPFFPPGMQWHWKGHYLKELNNDAIDTLVDFGSNLPTLMSTTHLYLIDGKAHDVGNNDTAWANRDARWAQVMPGIDFEAKNAELITDWSRSFYDAMKPYASSENGYVNFMMDDGEEKVKGTYGANFERLVAVKRKYDPDNFFHVNQNIKP